MGSKKTLALDIGKAISRTYPKHTVVDAFAGTCAIASQVAATNSVVVNDVHAFAATIGRALLSGKGTVPSETQVLRSIEEPFRSNLARLRRAIGPRMDLEASVLATAAGRRWKRYFTFVRTDLEKPIASKLESLPSMDSYRRNADQKPYALFTYLYGNTYFGIQQCAEIDSIRYAIDLLPRLHRDLYLFALLQSVSHCASAPGHFAQFLVPRDRVNTQLIARYRRRSVWGRFLEALRSMRLPECRTRNENLVFNQNAHAFAQKVLPDLASHSRVAVYADPPYSRAQYSRYYHLLETIIKYDYPHITGKGRYRDDRYETNFSRVGQVLPAMKSFVTAVSETRAPLFLSYPENGLLFEAGGDLREILCDRYPTVEVVVSRVLAHSTMGGAPGTGAVPVMEHVYYASF